jgi:hypothetical protein
MAITFPSSPTVGQTFTSNNKTWTWNGSSWVGNTSSSGDATTLDSIDSLRFVFGDNTTATIQTTNLDLITKSGFYDAQPGVPGNPFSDWAWVVHHEHSNNNGYGFQLAIDNGNPENLRVRTQSNNSWSAWRKYWNEVNDGPGSGLDADTLDGIQATSFLRGDTPTNDITADMNTLPSGSYVWRWNNTAPNRPAQAQANEYGPMLSLAYDGNRVAQFAYDMHANNLYLRQLATSTDTATEWAQVWTTTNDGAGSGLDADTVDGLQASQFVRSDTSDTMTGTLTLNGSLLKTDTTNNVGFLLQTDGGSGGRAYLILDSDASDGVGAGSDYVYIGSDTSQFRGNVTVGTGGLAGNLSVPNGKVGIGTSSPSALLTVASTSFPSTGDVLASFRAGTTSPTSERYVELFQTYTGAGHDSPTLVFRSNANASNTNSYGTIRTTANGTIVFSNINNTSSGPNASNARMLINDVGTVTVNRDLSLGGGKSLRSVNSWSYTNTGISASNIYVHMKTNRNPNSESQMYSVTFRGHAYSQSQPINTSLCWYNYSPVGAPINIGWSGTHSCSVYESSDGFAVMTIFFPSFYFVAFTFDQFLTAQGLATITITNVTTSTSATGVY